MRGILILSSLVMMASSLEAFIDCPTSCSKCQQNDEEPEIMEVYCSMCDECRQKTMDGQDRDHNPFGEDMPTDELNLYQKEDPNLVTPIANFNEEFTQPDNDDYMERSIEPITATKLMLRTQKTKPKFYPGITRYKPNKMKRQPSVQEARSDDVTFSESTGGGRPMQEVLAEWPAGCPTPPICEPDESEETTTTTEPTIPDNTRKPTTAAPTTTTKPPCPQITQCFKKKRIRRPPARHKPPPCTAPCTQQCNPPCIPSMCNDRSILQLTPDQISKLLSGSGLNSACNNNNGNSANQQFSDHTTAQSISQITEKTPELTTSTQATTTTTEKSTTSKIPTTQDTTKHDKSVEKSSENADDVVDEDDRKGEKNKKVLRRKKRRKANLRPGDTNMLEGKLMKPKVRKELAEDDDSDKDYYYLYVGVPSGLLPPGIPGKKPSKSTKKSRKYYRDNDASDYVD